MLKASNVVWWVLVVYVVLWALFYLIVGSFGSCFGSSCSFPWPWSFSAKELTFLLVYPAGIAALLTGLAYGLGRLAKWQDEQDS